MDPDRHAWSKGNSSDLPLDMKFNDGHRLSIVVYSVLMVLSSIGNMTVLVLLLKRRKKRPSRIDTMLTHLAIADLLVTFIMMPLEIGWAITVSWKAGDFMCRLMSFLRTFGLYLSSFVLVCISVDRYFAVIKPMKLAGVDRRGKIMLCAAWISSSICSLPQAIIFHVESHPNVTHYKQCVTYNFFDDKFHEVIYSFLGMIFMYALPLIIIIFCYASIYIELYKKSRKCVTDRDRFRRSNDDVLGRAKRKTLRMTITIVIVFIVSWTPFYVMSVWYWFDRESALKVDQKIQRGLFLFACTNSCMNPIVYGFFNIPRRSDKNELRNSNVHASMSKHNDSIDFSRRNSIANSVRNTVRKSVCVNCGESIELPNLRVHKTLYH
ncbi:gonadotropin-releasing hormone receptor isoform X2 [Contarinia nasturtii]|nr:gonadotropin-releasing hormone receptor isoform X2 [Contarinia nasturtii]XP_031632170.1 gonadotropin-releasing hormone receptor isoform X2 [Contarinia nasturtii]XP_031632171.1 gonadotropin-releasing hormone receptor isoform X2 [Contarinia nasturtii]XP_031632172.1 gonadotropin-releasing hormone receptor isoform X2 [Contarinia nasturtii]XP_031632174.1 gonadotropin-releasing hormone receptor isoform X2 [Contarinia nasturtii]XP_031632175.1 gonadotropin-releasing hormone receptor isoform X2 [Con